MLMNNKGRQTDKHTHQQSHGEKEKAAARNAGGA